MGCSRGFFLAIAISAAQAQSPVQLVKIADGFRQPVFVTGARDSSGRLFVVEQSGRIRIIRNNATLGTPFLDLSARISCCGERGLLGLAFPPGFSTKQRFYVYYTDAAGDITVSRFRVGASPDVADPASEQILLTINHRQFGNHQGGHLAFGPDGFLYIGTGDGGGAGDPLGNSQSKAALLGKILRIDVENGASPYGIPPGNPFVGVSGARPEVWAYGLRNPFRFSFDRSTGDLWIGDVGQNLYEEIDFQPAGAAGGSNYGWNIMEGFHCFQAGCSATGLTLPVAEYGHTGDDCAVIGGDVYRGSRFPSLTGRYFYADNCSGHIWQIVHQGTNFAGALLLTTGLGVSSFGEDDVGEIHITDVGGGGVYLLSATAAGQVGGVVNAASFDAGLAPGGLASVFGAGITTVSGVVSASALPLPTSLGGSSVLINGAAVPVLAVANVNGGEQINFQAPFDLAPGPASLVVSRNGGQTPPFAVTILQAAPALFTVDGTHAAAQHPAGFSPITASDPAAPGEVIVLYGTGLGPVVNAPASGAGAPIAPLATMTVPPIVTIGGLDATVQYSGLTPLAVGIWQLNVVVPDGLPAGENPIVVTAGGAQSKAVVLTVRGG